MGEVTFKTVKILGDIYIRQDGVAKLLRELMSADLTPTEVRCPKCFEDLDTLEVVRSCPICGDRELVLGRDESGVAYCMCGNTDCEWELVGEQVEIYRQATDKTVRIEPYVQIAVIKNLIKQIEELK